MWVGEVCLRVSYSRLFLIWSNKKACIADVLVRCGVECVWKFEGSFFNWKKKMQQD